MQTCYPKILFCTRNQISSIINTVLCARQGLCCWHVLIDINVGLFNPLFLLMELVFLLGSLSKSLCIFAALVANLHGPTILYYSATWLQLAYHTPQCGTKTNVTMSAWKDCLLGCLLLTMTVSVYTFSLSFSLTLLSSHPTPLLAPLPLSLSSFLSFPFLCTNNDH